MDYQQAVKERLQKNKKARLEKERENQPKKIEFVSELYGWGADH